MGYLINKRLSKTLASMAKQAEESLHRNNKCIQGLKHIIMVSNRDNLLTLKASLLAFTQREEERNFKIPMIDLYLQLIEQHLKKKPIG